MRSHRRRLHRRHAGGRHAGHRARAAQHDRPVRRRERLVGAARRRRAHQHLGQGQVPVGAGADRLVVGEQQGVRPAVRARQPVRARQAAACWAGAWPPSIRAPSSPTATRRCSGRGSTGSCRRSSSAACSPSSTTRNLRAPLGRSARPAWSRTAVEPAVGIAWFRRVKTQVAWRIEKLNFDQSNAPTDSNPASGSTRPGRRDRHRQGVADVRLPVARVRGHARRRARRGARGRRAGFGGDFKYWRAGASWEHGIKFFKSHNFIYSSSGGVGKNLPFAQETRRAGTNLRGYLYQQFRGDTRCGGGRVPLPAVLDRLSRFPRARLLRRLGGLVPQICPTMPVGPDAGGLHYYRTRRDPARRRTCPTTTPNGFSFETASTHAVGGGLRFFLRSVAVPLVGFDAGYGIEARTWRFILIIGA